MKYLSLKKFFHMDEQKCNEVYKNRINSEFCHKLGVFNYDNEFFYMVNDELITLIGKIYSINRWFDDSLNKSIPLTATHYLSTLSLIEEIRSSNNIEGIYSTRKEINDLVVNEEPKHYKRFYGMVNKYQYMMNYDFDKIETPSQIRKLYNDVLLKDVLEEDPKDVLDGLIFRKGGVEVMSSEKTLHKGILGEKNIIEFMEHGLKILNDEEINLMIRVAVFHYLIEYTHPFYNGNGRLGRFIASGYLSKELNILSAFQLSIACLHNNTKYYEAFKETNDIRNKADLTPFIITFLEIYYSGLVELKESVSDKINIYHQISKKIKVSVEHKDQELINVILERTLFSSMNVTMEELCKILELSQPSIRARIKRINQVCSIITINDKNKPYRYSIDTDSVSSLEA